MTDQKFFNLFLAMIAGFVVLGFLLAIIAVVVAGPIDEKMDLERGGDREKELVARIKPIGKLNIGEVQVAAVTQSDELSGEAVYQSSCLACHGTGVAGAPKLGDAAQWSERIAKGNDALFDSALNGSQSANGVMPARGGNAGLSDEQVKAAVIFMIEGSQ